MRMKGGSRSAAREIADASGRAPFDPEDRVAVRRLQQKRQMGANVGSAFAQARNLLDVLDALQLAFEPRQRVQRRGIGVAALFEKPLAVVKRHSPDGRSAQRIFARQSGKKTVGPLLDGDAGIDDGRGKSVLALEHRLNVTGQLVEALRAEADAEVVGGNLFQLVRFVEDDHRCLGQNARIGRVRGLLLDAQIGEEEMVVDDDDVRLKRLASHVGDEASLPIRAALAQAGLGASIELAPQRGRLRERVDLGTVPGLGRLLPFGDDMELLDLFEAVE